MQFPLSLRTWRRLQKTGRLRELVTLAEIVQIAGMKEPTKYNGTLWMNIVWKSINFHFIINNDCISVIIVSWVLHRCPCKCLQATPTATYWLLFEKMYISALMENITCHRHRCAILHFCSHHFVPVKRNYGQWCDFRYLLSYEVKDYSCTYLQTTLLSTILQKSPGW